MLARLMLLGTSPSQAEWLALNDQIRRSGGPAGHECSEVCYSYARKVLRRLLMGEVCTEIETTETPPITVGQERCLRARILKMCANDLGYGGYFSDLEVATTTPSTTVGGHTTATTTSSDGEPQTQTTLVVTLIARRRLV